MAKARIAAAVLRGAAALAVVYAAGCVGTPPFSEPTYLTTTDFYQLPYDMTKEAFIKEWQGARSGVIGAEPVVYTTYPGIDVWEVLIYEVYDHSDPLRIPKPKPDHREYVLFRNGELKAYGRGELTLSPYDVLVERHVLSEK
ncbi:MAG TPA: hypothetical protein PKX48_12730 [Planctomycetota bacterium]|nr:hypothetical protein [Planctomycetota bacterium]OQC19492.1 MAG: hypothetical protein BWX69_02693 [Planctomycetes bacterium ADurb.Bin069]HNS00463.1 hypothetical protein [Planctomycetota bacterium]HNU25300.1 hypothetical protein [Planctomycetota bacterium]HOE31411.1 hypothetical protein [Planctomycetota bacterium]